MSIQETDICPFNGSSRDNIKYQVNIERMDLAFKVADELGEILNIKNTKLMRKKLIDLELMLRKRR